MEVSVAKQRAVKCAVELYSAHRQTGKTIAYGTAGFRDRSDTLDWVLFRMGLLAALRSKSCAGAHIGVMITASHNPVDDNGVKLIDPEGEMLNVAWEADATAIVNCSDKQLDSAIQSVIERHRVDFLVPAVVMTAVDTRPSSERLCAAIVAGVEAIGGAVVNMGLLTTPQLHYLLSLKNSGVGDVSESLYFAKLCESYMALVDGECDAVKSYQTEVYVDGANGVGALKMNALAQCWPEKRLESSNRLRVHVRNDGTTGSLNLRCGADFVKVQQKKPEGFDDVAPLAKCASFDGDADRLMYFYTDAESGLVRLVDGDKIATLLASFIRKRLVAAKIDVNFGVVQTAYANGASTSYLVNDMGIRVDCVPTGVKHLHKKALDYDIAVYFEANGHGTVLFKPAVVERLLSRARDESFDEQTRGAARDVYTLSRLINQTVGDAICDLFAVEAVLRRNDWSVQRWNDMYTDLPQRQLKVRVADRCAITTSDAERRCVTPAGVQPEIDRIVSAFPRGRSFVRPSGTEDVVRIYSEASDQTSADALAHRVAARVYEMAGGIGDAPTRPQ